MVINSPAADWSWQWLGNLLDIGDRSIYRVTFPTDNGKLFLQTAQAWDGPNTLVGTMDFDTQTIPTVNRAIIRKRSTIPHAV